MYLSAYYEHQEQMAYVWDEDEGIISFKYKPQYYKKDPNGELLTLYGERVSSTNDYNKYDKDIVEKDVDKQLSILLDLYKDIDGIPTKHRKIFFDIEIEMGYGSINKEFCERAQAKVTAVALYDENNNEYYVWILDEDKKQNISEDGNIKIIPCVTENELLKLFLNKWIEINPTIVVGYNSDNFDIPYIFYRICKKLGLNEANKLSPIGIVKQDDYDSEMPIKIALVNTLDYLRLYKKFIPKNQPSYALDAICMTELGKGKIKYEGNLNDLFKNDIDTFIKYNVNDVQLIVELDNKKKFLDLAIHVATLGRVPYYYVYKSTKLLEGVIMTFCKKNNIISPNKLVTDFPELRKNYDLVEEDDDNKFAGAYVKEVEEGLYDWSIDLDLTSLYPSLMLQLNASPETLLFRIIKEDIFDHTWTLEQMKNKDQNKIITIEDREGKYRELSIGKLVKFIIHNNVILAPNGTGFSSDEKGLLCIVVEEWFNLRKKYKNLMKDAGKAGDKKMYDFYNIFQSIYKIMLNSIYGIMGTGPTCRYSDGKDIIAEAVTISGRYVIMGTGDWLNEQINDELGTDDDYVKISDTDSCFVYVTPLLKSRIPDIDLKDDNVVIPEIRKISHSNEKGLNEFYKNFTKIHFNTDNNRLDIKSETIIKSLYISAKKQYAQLVVEKEGVKIEGEDRFILMGLDFLKSNVAPIYKNFGKEILKDILLEAKKSVIDKKILDFREKFKTLSLEEAAKPTGLNKLSEYIKRKPRSGDLFSSLELKCPINTKSAIFYNDLLKFKGLDKKHSTIQIGDKMLWMSLKKGNPYNIEVLGFPRSNAAPEILEYIETYMDRNDMFTRSIHEKLQKIYNNMKWGSINYNAKINKFLKYIK